MASYSCCQEQLERQQSEGKPNSEKHTERKREQNHHNELLDKMIHREEFAV